MRRAYQVEAIRAAERALMDLLPDGALMDRAAAGPEAGFIIRARPADRSQKVLIAISAGAASKPAISSSRRLSVIEVPAISSDVQYSPT